MAEGPSAVHVPVTWRRQRKEELRQEEAEQAAAEAALRAAEAAEAAVYHEERVAVRQGLLQDKAEEAARQQRAELRRQESQRRRLEELAAQVGHLLVQPGAGQWRCVCRTEAEDDGTRAWCLWAGQV